MALHEAGDLRGAADIYREILTDEPDSPETLHLLGAVLSDGGVFDQSIPLFEKALAVGGPNSSVLFNYGVALRALDRLTQAARAFRHAAEASPGRADCWHNLGEAYRQLGRLTDAADSLEKAIEADPGYEPAWFNLGNTLLDLGRSGDAAGAFEKAVALNAENVEAQNNLGIALRQAGQTEQALAVFRRALEIDPANSAVYNNLGIALQKQDRLEEAVAAFTGAITAAPGNAEANCNLGKLYQGQEKYEQAAICYRSALAGGILNVDAVIGYAHCRQRQGRYEEALENLNRMISAEPDNLRAVIARANILRDQGHFDKALAEFDRVLSTVPDNPAALTDKALTLQHRGDCRQAVDTYRAALKFDPDNEQIHSNLAQAFLLSDQYEEGWEAFEHRLETAKMSAHQDTLPGERWRGESIAGKRLLVWCEQGLGDIIQFVRYLPLVTALGVEVKLVCPARMVRLLKTMDADVKVLSNNEDLPEADMNAPLMSLPYLLGTPDIPAPVSYLYPDPALADDWRRRLSGEGMNIGIAWQGNPSYQADRSRSVPLAELEPLLNFEKAQFYGLQKGTGADQIASLPNRNRIVDLGGELDIDAAFVDTAAVMAGLDLIISSDTAIPHLAGAIGCPVWLLTSYAPDWRWGLGRTDCPWYPSMRLFRQAAPGDWAGVVVEVLAALKEL